MRIIGVTGGVGSGKSEVLHYLSQKHSAGIIRLDDLGRRMLDPDGEGYAAAIRIFGNEIVNSDGSLSREKIAAIVYSDREKRFRLNALIHPAVKKAACLELEKFRKEDVRLAAIEAALILEEHYDEICDEVWYIYADEKTRAARLTQERGYSSDKTNAIMESQLSDSAFRRRSTFVIDNSGSFEDTKKAIDRLLDRKDWKK